MNQDVSRKIELIRIDRDSISETPSRFGLYAWLVFGLVLVLVSLFYSFKPPSFTFVITENSANQEVVSSGEIHTVSNSEGAQQAMIREHNTRSIEARESHPQQETFIVSGYVIAPKKSTISAQINGVIKSIYIREGDIISHGDILADLDSIDATLNHQLALEELKVLELQHDSLTADHMEKKRVLQRTLALYEKGLANDSSVTRLKTQVYRAKARQEEAALMLGIQKIKIQQAKEFLSKHVIKAPFSGVVVSLSAEVGETVSPSFNGEYSLNAICTIVDPSSMEVEVEVNELHIDKVFIGQKVDVVADINQQSSVIGEVVAVIRSVDKATGSVKVRVKMLAIPDYFIANMRVKARFNLQGKVSDYERI